MTDIHTFIETYFLFLFLFLYVYSQYVNSKVTDTLEMLKKSQTIYMGYPNINKEVGDKGCSMIVSNLMMV